MRCDMCDREIDGLGWAMSLVEQPFGSGHLYTLCGFCAHVMEVEIERKLESAKRALEAAEWLRGDV